ncbi:MAG: 50S ribosomal protein L35 [Planctomycetota bacterium]|nr:50S ribosomal protein L35 [Planctomycetota bacterium]
MPKQKLHKGVKKRRIRLTRKGKVLRRRAGSTHLMSGKSGGTKRRLKKVAIMTPGENKRARKLLGAG